MSEQALPKVTAAPGKRKGRARPVGAPRVSALARLAGLKRLPRDLAVQRVVASFKQPIFALPFYGLTLKGSDAAQPNVTPPDPWPGDAARGAAIAGGCFTFAGQTIMSPQPIFAPEDARLAWLREMHSFSWLRDLRAAHGDNARRTARDLTTAWLDNHKRVGGPGWEPLVIARRLSHWLGQWDFFAATADVLFRRRLIESACKQLHHLNRCLPGGLAGADLILGLRGLVIGGACLPGGGPALRRGLRLLMQELQNQVLVDGGHIERSPARHLGVLRDLIDLRATLHAAKVEAPGDLSTAIDAMAPMLRLFQHGDEALACFNGSSEEDPLRIEMVLQRADGRGRPRMSAPQSGFQRMQAGRTLVLVDAGVPPPPGRDSWAHAGTLSFEVSIGKERLFVNCCSDSANPAIQRLLRGTAAHNTLTVCDRNSSPIAADGGLAARPETVRCRREEGDGNVWLDLSHDGYRQRYGLVHHRRLFLADDGEDLRGEDRLDVFAESGTTPEGEFTIRFHLHPDVKASVLQDGETALLRLPKGGGWRLRSKGVQVGLEESLYLGHGGEQRRSQQVVLSGEFAPGQTVVKWALQREASRAR